ncbi:MAG TPA: cation diffusion facilitator family transporter [Solirubrobacteraceae bacterium]|nr:cation diffusion facilitator family transporter [Solirubrobacteraceae bacterium]
MADALHSHAGSERRSRWKRRSPGHSPQRTALMSVAAACALVAIKLVVGVAAHSLGLVAEAIHSGTDLVAALLTFFAVRVAGRPADTEHPYGHGKAEHLSALGESGILVIASLGIVAEAVARLSGHGPTAEAQWYVLAVVGAVIVIDALRSSTLHRAAHHHGSAALGANALHFTLDLVGSVTVLIGLLLVRAGYPQADSIAALLVAALVLFSAGSLMRQSVRVLMDTASGSAQQTARTAIAGIAEPVTVSRLRMRESGGRHFVDVVVGVEPDADLAHGHAVASAIEEAICRDLPGSDVVVHVEPDPRMGSRHLEHGPRAVITLCLGPERTLDDARALADELERSIRATHPEIRDVSVHTEHD